MMKKLEIIIFVVFFCFPVAAYAKAQPVSPPDSQEELDNKNDEPTLPPGLSRDDEPALPEGLTGGDIFSDDDFTAQAETSGLPLDITGFWEVRAGRRTQHDPHEKSTPLGESRLQVEISKQWTSIGFKLTSDCIYDTVVARNRIRLNKGEGWLDLREANLVFTPASFMDVKIGRQIMTWGTGDMIFINDLFPKDWISFFIGRDVEYLKAPSDTIRISLYSMLANLDFYYSPLFDSDRHINGRTISYWNTTLGKRAGHNMIIRTHRPGEWFRDHETGWRIFKNVRGYEMALYGYRGFWKSPVGMNPVSGKATFPDLNVYGASIRGKVFKGIGNVEFGYYDSDDDRNGRDPFVKNSEVRLLIGYDIEAAKDFTVAVQYYMEHMRHHRSYSKNLFRGTNPQDRHRHMYTLRLTKLLMNQNLTLSLFVYFSPSDSDTYMRPNIHYKITDEWAVEAGGNIFYGRHSHTFFGQFEKNTNIFISIRKYFNI